MPITAAQAHRILSGAGFELRRIADEQRGLLQVVGACPAVGSVFSALTVNLVQHLAQAYAGDAALPRCDRCSTTGSTSDIPEIIGDVAKRLQ